MGSFPQKHALTPRPLPLCAGEQDGAKGDVGTEWVRDHGCLRANDVRFRNLYP